MKPAYYRQESKDDYDSVKEIFDETVYRPNWFLFKPENIRRVVDVGALIGSFTLWALERWPKAIIHTYEPDPDNYSFLLKNVQAADIDQRVKPYNLAVWKNDTELPLYTHKLSRGCNSVIYKQTHYTPNRAEIIKVKTCSMVNVIEKIGGIIDYLKIDCEGAEYEILFSLSAEMLQRIKFLTVEFHNFNLEASRDPHKLTDHLRRAGFVTQIVPRGFRTGMEHGYIYAAKLKNSHEALNAAFDEEENRLLKMLRVDITKTKALQEKDEYNISLTNAVQDKDGYITDLNKTVQDKDGYITDLNKAVQDKDGYITDLSNELQIKDEQIQQIEDEIKHLTEQVVVLENSFGAKLARFCGPTIDKYFPNGTKRRGLMNLAISSAKIMVEEGSRSLLYKATKTVTSKMRKPPEPEVLLSCDSPLLNDHTGTSVIGSIAVAGWAICKKNTIKQVRIYLDNNFVGESKLGLTRPDVYYNYPDWKNSSNAGFEYLLDTSKTNAGEHLLKIIAETEDSLQVSKEGKIYVESVAQSVQYDSAVCTIASKNYIAFARVFADSYLKHNQNGKVFLLLVDDVNGYFKPTDERFEIVNVHDLAIPYFEAFAFKYTMVELCTALKPYLLEYLIQKYSIRKLVYFDPDILITHSLRDLIDLLDNYSIVLTPHLLQSLDDGYKPSDVDILKAGIFNLGFIGLRNDSTTMSFLDWWKKKLYNFSIMDPNKGYHTDQKWIDFVPSLFANVHVLREPGYNVAYWNLSNRLVTKHDGEFYVNDETMYFFHFSGFDPENIEQVSKHQNRFTLDKLPNLKPLFEMYRDLLLANGYSQVKKWPCSFDYFDNGVRLPETAKKIFYELGNDADVFGNPYSTSNEKSFFNWLRGSLEDKSERIPIARFWLGLYKLRHDIQRAYPDVLGENREGFITWIKNSSAREHNIDKKFLQPVEFYHTDWAKADAKLLDMNRRIFTKKSRELRQAKSMMSFGINFAGYFTGEFGIGESSRGFAYALRAADIPHVLINITENAHRNLDSSFKDFSDNNPHAINLIHVNADMAQYFFRDKQSKFFKDRYNIGIWYWELDAFPDVFSKSFRYYDEIWVTSDFMAHAISKASPVPVIKMPYPFYFDVSDADSNRSSFGLSMDDYVFLFLFDFYSVFERKNPLGVIRAFRNTFKQDENAKLVINCINSKVNPKAFEELKEVCTSHNVKILDGHLSRKDYKSLMKVSDCYVSLHRSEGFGIVMAQAMNLKKPVIATGYSGNMEFMNVNNSFLVKYNLAQLERDYGPYQKGNVWAEPDLDHAAQLMRLVYEDKEKTKIIAERASADIKQLFNPTRTGYAVLNRLEQITAIKKVKTG